MTSSKTASAQQHAHHHQSVFAGRPLLRGIAVGIATLSPHVFLPPQASLAYAAVIIGLLAIWRMDGLI